MQTVCDNFPNMTFAFQRRHPLGELRRSMRHARPLCQYIMYWEVIGTTDAHFIMNTPICL